jgi:hypothetical protein
MLALNRNEFPVVVGKGAVFTLFQVIVGLFGRQAVLILTGHPAGMASHALRLIDDHPVSGHFPLP